MPGMKLSNHISLVNTSVYLWGIPKALLLHCDGKDIGGETCGAVVYHLKFTIAILFRMLPGCSLIWSSILPRRTYRYSKNNHAMETTRKRINRGVRSYILKHGGYAINYPDRHPALYRDNGVHLSLIGNDIVINQIQSALETFRAFQHCFFSPYD